MASTCLSLMPRQRDLLRYIRGFQLANGGASPSYQTMADGIGLRSKSGAYRLVDGLERRGAIRRKPDCQRSIEVLVHVAVPTAPDGAPLHAVAIGGAVS